jgi:hypothetical protein
MGPSWGPAAVGAILGVAFASLNRLGMKCIWRAPRKPLNVVLTGGTRGLGKAMAREFLRCKLRPVRVMVERPQENVHMCAEFVTLSAARCTLVTVHGSKQCMFSSARLLLQSVCSKPAVSLSHP